MEVVEVGIKVTGAKDAAKQVDDIDNATKKLGTGVEGASTALDKLTGGAVTGFKNAVAGTKSFIKGLKLTRVALISTGIGAIVVAVGALVAAFMSTNKGAKMLKTGLAALGAIVERVTGYFQAAGAFIVGLFTGGVTQAVNDYNAEMEKLPGTMQDAINKAIELERRTQALRTAQRDLSVEFAEGRAQIKEYNLIAEDTTRGLEERLEAAENAIAIERELMAERQRIAQEEFDIAKQKAAQSDSSEEDLDNLAQLEVNLINIRTESAEMQTTLNNKINTIRQQAATAAENEANRIKAAEDKKQAEYEQTARAKEAELRSLEAIREEGFTLMMTADEKEMDAVSNKYMKLIRAEEDYQQFVRENASQFSEEELQFSEDHLDKLYNMLEAEEERLLREQKERKQTVVLDFLRTEQELELMAFDEKANALLLQAEQAGIDSNIVEAKLREQRQAIVDKYNAEEIASEKAKAEAVKQARLGLTQSAFAALKAAAKTQEGQKNIAIAEILVNQGIALSNAIAGAQQSATATGPGAIFTAPGFTATAIALVLSSFAQIKGIMNQAGAAVETASGGGGGGGGGNRPSPFVGAMVPDLDQLQEAQGSAGALPPVQAYVVQSQLADTQAQVQEIQSRASLDG